MYTTDLKPIDSQTLNELKRKMATDKEIAHAMEFFFDHFVDSPGFMSLGYAKELPEEVKQGVYQALGTAFGKARFLIEWLTGEIPEMQIIHGTVSIDGKPGVILWASDIKTGILSIPKEVGSAELLYIRLSLTPQRDKRTVN
jgi:hypothetical protein